MKKHTFKRAAAALAACAMMAAAMPLTSAVTSMAAVKTVVSSDFESNMSGWAIYKESGGAATLKVEDGKLAIHITNQGKVNYAVQPNFDIVPLYENGVYRFSFEISSTTPRYVESMIQMNGGDYRAYTWKGFTVTETPKVIDYEFTMTEATDIMTKMCFNMGIQEKQDGGPVGEHTVYLDNVILELIDDSEVDYSANKPYEPQIITDQIGYKPDAKKTAVFRNVPAGSSDSFAVVDAATDKVVYEGKLSSPVENKLADETNFTADFSDFKTPGRYYIQSGSLDKSYEFEIGDKVYTNLLDASVRMLYLQRCGTAIEDTDFSHPSCHDSIATIYHTDQKIDVTGGWHDAGDYGRYVVPAAKAVADLMYAYKAAPDMYGDSLGIPESGNGTPDILDETRYELEWMMKMQDKTDGGVYHKVSCDTFPGYVMPEKETKALIVMPKTTTSTADFAASMALAYEVYKDIDSAFADSCLAAAKKAYEWAKANPKELYLANPADISTGAYEDKNAADELYWAAAQLYAATGDKSYLDGVTAAKTGLDWSTVGDYGNIAILTMKDADTSSDAYKNAAAAINKQAGTFLKNSNASPYGVALDEFNWGSNMTVANAGIILALAYQNTGEQAYLDAANAQLHYLLGTNPLGASFVTGYGTVAPENPHHRPSMAVGKAMPGMLVGGVNSNLEDSAAKAYCQDSAPAKCWIDNGESYSTNEITIYWNSPLTYLLSLTDGTSSNGGSTSNPPVQPSDKPAGGTMWGDVNKDNLITVADAARLLQYLGNGDKYALDDVQKANADVHESGNGLSALDALAIQKYDAKVIDSLPESYMTGGSTQQPTNPPVAEPTEAPTTAAPATSAPKPETTTAAPAPSNGIKDYGTPMNEKATAVEDFRDGSSKLFIASDGWENGDPFDCFWYKQNTSLENGMLTLTIDKDHKGKYNYSGAEYRTNDFYGYGYYETSMQAIKNPGVVSSFFTYTGPSDDNPWDEIDIEVLGKDTTKVQFNYYTNGEGNHEYMYDLGFDASEGFHTYGFDWQPDHIAWFVDGKEVHRATSNIPVTPGKIMMNTWPGRGVDEWLAPFDGKTPLSAHYQWVTYNK